MRIDRRGFAAGAGALALAGCTTAVEGQGLGSWRELPTEPYPRKQDDIFFISRRAGWYGNGAGKVYRTDDGGNRWDKVWDNPGTFVRALGFATATDGWLGNVGVGFAQGVTDATPLYRTGDGGVSWAPVAFDGSEGVKGICAIDVLQLGAGARDGGAANCIVHAGGRVGGPAMLLRSLDGGETWRLIDLAAQAGMILDVKFLDPSKGFVCAATSSDLGEASASILRTLDGGHTWTEVYRSSRRPEICWKMSFPSPRVGYATVQNNGDDISRRVVVKTTDGGASWRELPLIDDVDVREFGVGFLTERIGWVGASTTGFQTEDGGDTWTPVDMGLAVNKIRIVREGRQFSAFAIGRGVARLDGVVPGRA